MQACSLPAPQSVASVPGQKCRRGVSLCLGATRIEAGTDRSGRSLESVLLDVGIEASVLGSVRQRAPELSCISVQDRVEPLLQCLQSLQLQSVDLRVMLLRCPRLLSFSTQRQVLPVVQFLREDLRFDGQQVASVLRRFPGIMGYGVKSHLVPHCHYLRSLGVAEEELPRLILARPQVLGTSIELVIDYLRKWLRIERTHVGRLLWSYPLDYSLPRLVLPMDATAADSSIDEASSPNILDSSSDSSGGASSSAPAQLSSSSGDGGSSGGSAEEQQQQQPKQVPLWGSAEACSWLDIDLRKGKGAGYDGSSGDGGSKGDGSKQPPSAA